METLTVKHVRECLHYDPDTGILRWNARPKKHFVCDGAWAAWNTRFAGKITGSRNEKGYLRINIGSRLYMAHRLAWFYMNGKWPDGHIDHKNGDPEDNRLSNLRLANDRQNAFNAKCRATNKLGVKGVCRKPNGKYHAQISVNGKRVSLGYYTTVEDAHNAYRSAAKRYYKEYARFG